ncbi:MAG: DUF2153 domain-containing protein [Desulfurococcaceae archaeon]|jgi:hypothetical protein|nr:DUF2153 domain-containing protein [Desulfurococcaceae archaeon]MCC6052884.1 DUF2153 domain-containing protein [Desulfurococcaceae archaeon]
MSSFYENLELWVKKQEEVKELFGKAEENYDKADRLTLITLTRLAFHQMERTIEAFDNWLKDPMITVHMPREMLVDLWSRVRKVLYELIDIDVEHTKKFTEHLKDLEAKGLINPLFTSRLVSDEEKRQRRPTVTI